MTSKRRYPPPLDPLAPRDATLFTCIESERAEQVRRVARELGFRSYSQYIRQLIIDDLNKRAVIAAS